VKKSNDLATFVEARLGKPSHLLEGDKLKQFLAQVCMLPAQQHGCGAWVSVAAAEHVSTSVGHSY
jgi:hypothetical protein